MHAFVYGTLKSGNFNNYILTKHCEGDLIEKCTIPESEGLAMADLGGFPAVYHSNCPTEVVGEIWKINTDQGILWLDSLEDYPRMYNRKEIIINGINCIIYFMEHGFEDYPKIKEWQLGF